MGMKTKATGELKFNDSPGLQASFGLLPENIIHCIHPTAGFFNFSIPLSGNFSFV